MTREVDVAIIGVGSAGMNAYRAARAHTGSVLTIESGVYGTMCARVGCMPSKLLIAAAEAANAVRRAPLFGVRTTAPDIDGVAVMRRVREERDRFTGFAVESVAGWPAEHRLKGAARFVAPGVLQVSGPDGYVRVAAQRVVIATGSQPQIPEAWRTALGDRLMVNDDVFYWQDLPSSVAVMGTGVIGLELAQALAALGVRVRLFGRSGRIGPLTDPALQPVAHDCVAATLQLSARARVTEVRRDDETVTVVYDDDTGAHTEHFDCLLAATGRIPSLEALDLPAAGIIVNQAGVPDFDESTMQVAGHPVFIAGDVNARSPLLHEAADDGRIAGDNAGRWPDVAPQPRRAPLTVVFSHPQIMLAGQTFKALTDAGHDFVTGAVDFTGQGRSRVMGVNQGRLHVYADRANGALLGAEMVGPDAEHLGHLLSWSIQQRLSVAETLTMPFYHPVVEEGLRTALRDAEAARH